MLLREEEEGQATPTLLRRLSKTSLDFCASPGRLENSRLREHHAARVKTL